MLVKAFPPGYARRQVPQTTFSVMKTWLKNSIIASSILMALSMQAKIITVNTADNTDFSAGKTNLVRAINTLADGDTIQFNIPGSGAHRLVTPPIVDAGGGGYPIITNNNVTIGGFSQPGSSPNSHKNLA